MTELAVPWVPEGRLVRIEGRGELFARIHRHPDPDADVVLLLHGWTASSDLQFFTAYEALAARFTLLGIDHQGHGRGLRTPERFSLEAAADDAAALVRALELGPVIAVGYSMGGPISMLLARRHAELVSGLVVQATALSWRYTRRDRLRRRLLPLAGSWLRTKAYRRYVRRAVPKLLGVRAGQPLDGPVQRYVPWLIAELSRGDPFVITEAGQAIGDYDARPWAESLGVPAASLVTTADRLVPPTRQRALAAALRATVRELDADHFAPLTNPDEYAGLTVELIDDVRQRSSASADVA